LAPSGVALSAGRGEFLSVVGLSGCGKSSILNLVAVLSRPTSGQVGYDGRPVHGPNTRVGNTWCDSELGFHANVGSGRIALPDRSSGSLSESR
jgi:ABC-type nitrate/sulfonate/bicarbonate transport system ATPase subunit